MARKRPTVTEEEVQIARKGLLWGVPLCFALGALILVGSPGTILNVPNELRAGAPIVRIWPGSIIKYPLPVLLLTCLVVIVFRAIPWPVAYIRAGKVAIWVMLVTLATMAFALIGVPPLSSYYMSTHGYHRCELFADAATRRWFTDWVKDPKWCVPGKRPDWVKEQAAKEAKEAKEATEKPRSP